VLRSAGIECPVVSVGSTPTVRHSARVDGVTEIRPGNYVFHDRIQVGLGVVERERCALTVLATVVARPGQDRVVLDAGSKALSSDRGVGGGVVQGFAEDLDSPSHVVTRISEEHGIVDAESGASYRTGDRVRLIPNHACVTTNLHGELTVVRESMVVDVWPVAARGRSA
jgi:D-serine deaminase-like pyridoxal phosphate-dependent protein